MASVSQTDRNSSAKFRPHLGTCLMLGRNITFDIKRALRNCFVIGSYSRFGIGIELALSWLSEAAGS